ncbi:MAG: glycosyltransferase [Conexivisphaera sp.]
MSSHDLIYASVYGTGLGHAYRTTAILRVMSSRGYRAVASSWGEGLRYLRSRGVPSLEVPELDVVWGEEGKMRFKDTVRRLAEPFARLAQQIEVEDRLMARLSPRLVISDSRVTPVLAARRRNIRSALVLNQARLMAPRALGAVRPALEVPPAQVLAMAWSAASVVLVPDLPPPYTIAGEQLSAVPQLRGKLRFVGLPIETCGGRRWSPPRRPFALFSISGPEETKRPAVLKSMAAARLLARRGWSALISTASAGSVESPREVEDGVYVCGWCECIDDYVSSADVVVSRAGHTSVGKAIYYGKPSVLLPIPFHGEQESNALRAQRMGVARVLMRSDLAAPGELADAVEEALDIDGSAIEDAMRVARSMDFAKLSAAAIEELLQARPLPQVAVEHVVAGHLAPGPQAHQGARDPAGNLR